MVVTEVSQKPPRKLPAAEALAALRYSVLLGLEQNGRIESSGLSEAGQRDLQFVFARTSALAALSHVQAVGTRIFDERVRDRGFYHICRLPIFWENQIHAVFRSGALADLLRLTAPLEILRVGLGIEPTVADAKEGAVNAGALDLTKPASRKTLASMHADAMAAERLVIPFFELP
jgi:hypothetical protein